MITEILTTIAVGAVVGAIGRLVLPGRQQISAALAVLVGILAAFIGTAVARALGLADTPGVDWIELALQVALAALGVGLLAGRRTPIR